MFVFWESGSAPDPVNEVHTCVLEALASNIVCWAARLQTYTADAKTLHLFGIADVPGEEARYSTH